MKKPVVLYVTLYLPMRNVHGGANRMFEQLKNLSPEYDIRLVSFLRDWEEPGLADLKAYCSRIDSVRIRDKHSRSFSLTEQLLFKRNERITPRKGGFRRF